MTDKAKEARRAYKRQWAKNHPESVKRSQEKYWEKQAVKAMTAESDNQHDDRKETIQNL